jgi:hypothetical protein
VDLLSYGDIGATRYNTLSVSKLGLSWAPVTGTVTKQAQSAAPAVFTKEDVGGRTQAHF